MPTNRHAAVRYQVIDRCLRQRNVKWTATLLAEACAEAIAELDGDATTPSRSSIGRDIRTMRLPRPLGYEAPIVWDARAGTYYYSEQGYSITEGPMREEDLRALNGALAILREFRYFGQVQGLEEITARLQYGLKASAGRQGSPVIMFSQPPETPAYRWLDFLYQAIEEEHCLLLRYQPFSEEPFQATVSPYLLKEYNNRWFLIAYHHGHKRLHTFALDRIQQASRQSLHPYYHTPHFDPATYFNDIVGVTILEGRQMEVVSFRATPLRARYLATKPVHSSQKVVSEQPDHVIFSLQLIPNFELESLLLSFAEEIRVLEPQWLAARLKKRLEQAARGYDVG